MVLVPMQDARQRRFRPKLLQGDLHPHRPEADMFGGIADSQHRHSFARDKGLLAEVLHRVAAAVVLRDHAEAGGAAVGGIELGVVRERIKHFILYDKDLNGQSQFHN